MAQHDYVVDNQAGAGFRADLNNALAAIATTNSGPTEPMTKYAYMFWQDTSAALPVLKQRSAANDAWTVIGITSMPGLGIAPVSVVRGLLGAPNAGTPLTKFDLSADAIVLRSSNATTFTEYGVATSTVDLGLAGPIVNGRDQAVAFPASSWVHIYRIANPLTGSNGWVASLASSTTGPTLPAGYTHWCYATTIRWNASSNIVQTIVSGRTAYYDTATAINALSNGAATTMTSVSLASLIPPVSRRGIINFRLIAAFGSPTQLNILARQGGSTQTGLSVCEAVVQSSSATASDANTIEFPVSASQAIEYRLNVTPTAGGAFIDVAGYIVPNGDS